MSKKKLNTSVVIDELAGQSVFFQKENPPKKITDAQQPVEPQVDASSPVDDPAVDTDQPVNHDANQPSNHDTVVSRYHDATVEIVRKAVKEFGKEAATHRFTQEEKRAIADMVYTYRRQGIRTSENEIARIAINLVLQEYREYGEDSLIDRVLKALNE